MAINWAKAQEVLVGAIVAAGLLFLAGAGEAQAKDRQTPNVTGKVTWGLWVDADGCMHWYADGGVEGYMHTRMDPKSGRPVCLQGKSCLVENSDTLFASGSAVVSGPARDKLIAFFREEAAFSYAIYGHTDARASDAFNRRLSQRRAEAVAKIARDAGAFVEHVEGLGESRPVAGNTSAAGMRQNRRVEIVCYRLPE